MTQRDWQKDWDRATMFDDIEFLVNNPRPLLNVNNYEPPYVLLKYWLQEAKEQKKRGDQMLELLQRIKKNADEFRALTGVEEHVNIADQAEAFNTILIAEKARADAAEAREQEIKRASGRCLVAGNSLGSIIMNYNLPEGHEEWSFQEANSYFFSKFYNDRPSAYESYETWIAWKAIMGASEIVSTLYPDTTAPKEGTEQ